MATPIDDIKPISRARVIDLVEEAGVDVSDWSNFEKGAAHAASNPKYCYEWAFVEPQRVVVLNLWYDKTEEIDGLIVQRNNFRADAKRLTGVLSRRARSLDGAISRAMMERLTLRVIMLAGTKRDLTDPEGKSSQVDFRKLDPLPWRVTRYDNSSGSHILVRGEEPHEVVDQFTDGDGLPTKKEVTSIAYGRDSYVRRQALDRSKGRCEFCGVEGFTMLNGKRFIETHHIVPLSEGGADKLSNVIALCANHHREAHYGISSAKLRSELINKIRP